MINITRPKPYIGILVFILVIALMIIIAAPLQHYLGMWGVALTQIMLLACAIIPALLIKWDLREVFKFKVPLARQVLGVILIWIGGYLTAMPVTMIITYLFPQGMLDVSTGILDLFKELPFPVTFFIIAVMPAVCEEFLHRGFILYTLGSMKKWTTIIIMAVIFGIFHLDPYRFLVTAVLGFFLTYIMIETRNILLPMLFHFINNALSAVLSLVPSSSAEVTQIPFMTVGIFILLSAVVPFLFLGGSALLKTKEEIRKKPIKTRVIWIAAASTLILAAAGFIIIIISLPEFLSLMDTLN